MKKILKWTGIVLGALVLLLVAGYAFIHFKMEASIDKTYVVQVKPLAIPDDSTAYAMGKHVAEVRGCMGCHGADLGGGMAFFDESTPLGVLYAPNITGGKGGIQYADEDWLRALRHGLGKDGKSLWFMPSQEFCHISNQEMAALISFLKKQPAVDRSVPPKSIKPLGRVLAFKGELPLMVAERIDHKATHSEEVVPAATAEYGAYLAVSCTGCHGPKLKGGPGHGPGEPPIPDISKTGNPGKWSESGFVTFFQTNKTPDGRVVSQFMPVKDFNFSELEIRAIYQYLQGVQ